MMAVFVRQQDIRRRDFPVDGKCRVVPRYSTFRLWMVVIVAFVLEYRRLAENREAVGKTLWQEKLAFIVSRKLHGHMMTVCGAVSTYIHCHVENTSLHHTYQLGLGIWRQLEMQTPHHTIA